MYSANRVERLITQKHEQGNRNTEAARRATSNNVLTHYEIEVGIKQELSRLEALNDELRSEEHTSELQSH